MWIGCIYVWHSMLHPCSVRIARGRRYFTVVGTRVIAIIRVSSHIGLNTWRHVPRRRARPGMVRARRPPPLQINSRWGSSYNTLCDPFCCSTDCTDVYVYFNTWQTWKRAARDSLSAALEKQEGERAERRHGNLAYSQVKHVNLAYSQVRHVRVGLE